MCGRLEDWPIRNLRDPQFRKTRDQEPEVHSTRRASIIYDLFFPFKGRLKQVMPRLFDRFAMPSRSASVAMSVN